MMADEVLQQGVRGITDLMVMPGLINLDFADVRSVMSEMGKAMMGTGEAGGDNRAIEAAEQAIANPLLDGVSMKGAKGVIISITGGEDMRLMEVDEAANHIRELVDPDANIIWGSAFNNDLDGKIRVSVVATGIGAEEIMPMPQPAKVFAFPAARSHRRRDARADEAAEEPPAAAADHADAARRRSPQRRAEPMDMIAEAARRARGDDARRDHGRRRSRCDEAGRRTAARRGEMTEDDMAGETPTTPAGGTRTWLTQRGGARGRRRARAARRPAPCSSACRASPAARRRRRCPRRRRRTNAPPAHRHPRPARHPAFLNRQNNQ